jgi:hypothetical protein
VFFLQPFANMHVQGGSVAVHRHFLLYTTTDTSIARSATKPSLFIDDTIDFVNS